MRINLTVPVRSTAIAVAALVVAASGGYAVASTSGTSSIQACAKKSNGALRLASKCKKSEKPVTWAVQGPTGATGPAGAPGSNGVSLFARVDDTGVLHQHSAGVTISAHTTTGLYQVTFPQSVANCVAVANTGPNANNSETTDAQFETLNGSDFGQDAHTIFVSVVRYNAGTDTASAADAGFNLIVAC